MKKEKSEGMFSQLGSASVMGLHFVSGPLVGGFLGWLIDKWLDSGPWGIGIGVLLGIVAGYKNVLEDAKKLRQEHDNPAPVEEVTEEEKDPHTHISYSLFGDGTKEDITPQKPENKE